MIRLRNLWHKLTAPRSQDEDDAIIEFVTKAILVILGGILLVATIPILLSLGLVDFDLQTLVIIFLLDATVVLAYWISHRGYWQFGSNVPTALFFLLGVHFSFNVGLVTTGILFYFISLVLTGFLKSARDQWLVLVLSVLTHLVVGWLSFHGPLEELVTVGIMTSATYSGVVLLQQLFTGQLRRAITRARSSEERMRSLFNGVPVGLYRTTPEGEILDVNPALLEMLGYPDKRSLLEVRASDLYVDLADRERFWGELQQNDSILGFEMQIRRQDSSIIWVKDTVNVVKDSSGKLLQAEGSLEDITERVRYEETLRRQLDELRVLHSIARAGTDAVDEDHLIASVTEILSESFYPDHFGVLLLDEESGSLWVHPSYRGIEEQHYKMKVPLGEGISGSVAASGKPIYIPDVAQTPEYLPITPGIASELCVPMQVDGRIIGVINAESRMADAFTPSDERFLMTAADQLATAIVKFRLLATTRQRLEYLTALRRIDQAITANLDLRPVLALLLEQVTEQLRVDSAVIWIYSPISHTLKFAAQRGLAKNAIQSHHLPVSGGYTGQAILERRIIQIPDLRESNHTHESWVEAEGFVSYFSVPLIAKGQVKGVLEIYHRSPIDIRHDWLDFLDSLSAQAAIAIDNASLFEGLQKANVELVSAYDSTIEGWSRALDLRDRETEGHSQRVTELTLRLARALGMKEEELVHIRRGALLHDIGKMGIPDHILLKPGPLTDAEWAIMRRHPVYAYELLYPITHLRPAIEIPYSHHEKWDGSGYPLGFKETQIPLAARIFTLVDVWDALRSDRPYRPAWSDERALEYIQTAAGTHFDPAIVDIFLNEIKSTILPLVQGEFS